jgi:hypothetical protein
VRRLHSTLIEHPTVPPSFFRRSCCIIGLEILLRIVTGIGGLRVRYALRNAWDTTGARSIRTCRLKKSRDGGGYGGASMFGIGKRRCQQAPL